MDPAIRTFTFRAMDTDIDIEFGQDVPVPGPELHALALSVELLFRQQEQRFSRFIESSDLSRFNRGEVIDTDWFDKAMHLALEATNMTAGVFNPMVLPALRDAGYVRSFSDLEPPISSPTPTPAPRLADCIRREEGGWRLLHGAVDLAGIVKGWTVDLAIELLAPTVDSCLVNAGGDLRCIGRENSQQPAWQTEVTNPLSNQPAWSGSMTGALATSTTARRRWRAGDTVAHHLIDPRTGAPSNSSIIQASCWAPETWRAEVWAKAIVIAGEPVAEHARRAGVRSLLIRDDGTTVDTQP